jgi:hypothetical protein
LISLVRNSPACCSCGLPALLSTNRGSTAGVDLRTRL